jgi:hypothetical protein
MAPLRPFPVGIITSRAINAARARFTVERLQQHILANVAWLGYALAPFLSVKLASASNTRRWDAVTSGSRHMGPINRHVMPRDPIHSVA